MKEDIKGPIKAKCMKCNYLYEVEDEKCICKQECPRCGKIGSSVIINGGKIMFLK